MDSNNEDECKIITYDDIIKLKGNEKAYKDALTASSEFNKRLSKDRKQRVPFLDSQTRVAQTSTTFSVSRYQRRTLENSENNFVFQYPIRRWLKQRRLILDPSDSNLFPNTTPIKTDENTPVFESGLNLQQHTASNSSLNQISKLEVEQEETIYSNAPTQIVFDDSFENDDNDDSDDNDYEDSKRKRRKNAKRGKKADSVAIGDDKPFVCDRCGIKYKTKPGLSYHIQKAHNSQSNLAHNNSGLLNQNSMKSDSMNPDENTNSMLGYDDMNSSSSLHHVQSNNSMSQQYQYHHS